MKSKEKDISQLLRKSKKNNFVLPDSAAENFPKHVFSKQHEEAMKRLFQCEDISSSAIPEEIAEIYINSFEQKPNKDRRPWKKAAVIFITIALLFIIIIFLFFILR